VSEANSVRGDAVPGVEEPDRKNRNLGNLPLIQKEDPNGDNAKDDETDGCGRVPREGNATKLESKQPHDSATNDKDTALPVQSQKTLFHRRARIMQLQEEDKDDEGNSADGKVDIKTPSPSNLAGKDTAKNRSNSRGQRPYHAEDTKVHAAVSHGKEIANSDIGQHNETSSTDTLDRSRGDEHAHVNTHST